MTRRAFRTAACATLAVVGAAIGPGRAVIPTNAAAALSDSPLDLVDRTPEHGPREAGRQIFRRDTFGDEQLWTGVLRMHEVVPTLSPAAALSVETVRRALLRLGVGWKRAKRWLTSPDPAYAQKNAAATG